MWVQLSTITEVPHVRAVWGTRVERLCHVFVRQLFKGTSLEAEEFQRFVQLGNVGGTNSFEEVVCEG